MGLLLSLITACAPANEDFGIQLQDLSAERNAGGLAVRARQEIELSDEAVRALRHGVPLHLRVDLATRDPGSWSELEERSLHYDIRYLPLSDHYQLSGPGPGGPARTYPRLRHVLAELRDIEVRLATAPGAGAVVVRIRSRLDRNRLPGPMQLPALLSSLWAHDSGWVSREIELDG